MPVIIGFFLLMFALLIGTPAWPLAVAFAYGAVVIGCGYLIDRHKPTVTLHEGAMTHHNAAFINAIAEEGTKAEAIEWLQKQWNETCELRAAMREILELGAEKDLLDAWAIAERALSTDIK